MRSSASELGLKALLESLNKLQVWKYGSQFIVVYLKVPLTPKMFLKHLQSLYSLEINCNLSCRTKISSL